MVKKTKQKHAYIAVAIEKTIARKLRRKYPELSFNEIIKELISNGK